MKTPRMYINGFPKSGLHLAERMVVSMFDPVRSDYNWYGTNAWSTSRHNLEEAATLAVIQPGQYLHGHTGWLKSIEEILIGLEIGMVLVYRDLRDVVVSQAHHILSDSDKLNHPAREIYPDDIHEVMKTVITGIDDYEGVFERWDTFAPWLEKDWVFPITYRELLRKPQRAAKRFLEYCIGIAYGEEVMIDKELKNNLTEHMVGMLKQRESATFRKGKTGTWKEEFTPEITELFKAHDTKNVIVGLGFEKDNNWQ